MRFSKSARGLALVLSIVGAPVAAIATVAPASADQPTASVAFIDFERIEADVEEGKNAHDDLTVEQGKRQGEIASREAEIKRMQDELQKQGPAFSKDAIEKKAAAYQQALLAYQDLVAKFNKELGDKERDLFGPIERKIRDLLRTVANRDGYDMILSKRSVPYGRKDLDLTDKMIEEYNRAYPGRKAAAATAKPPPATTTSAKKPPPASSAAPKMP